jgi:hypothetical protein
VTKAASILVVAALVVTALLTLLRGSNDRQADDDALVERLRALGYVEQVTEDPDPTRAGVVQRDPGRTHPGVNVYCSVRSGEVKFLDMSGRVLHTITLPEPGEGSDCLLVPDGAGGFLALTWPLLIRIDWDSTVQWVSRKGHHHDLAVDEQGLIYTLSQKPGVLYHGLYTLPIQDHSILVLDLDGAVVQEIELSPLFRGNISRRRLELTRRLSLRPNPKAYELASDVYHPNTIAILDRDTTFGERGHLLLCLRELDLVAVLDLDREAVVWRWGTGRLDHPHHPSLLPNGQLLIFDNGPRRGWSRLIQLDPAKRKIVWSYRGDPPESFFSEIGGAAQTLPNGNVLVTESTKGRVFEIARDGEIVWEFRNPDRTPAGKRRQIYRMRRFAPEELGPRALLGAATGPPTFPTEPPNPLDGSAGLREPAY